MKINQPTVNHEPRTRIKKMNEEILSPASGKVLKVDEDSRTITIFMHLYNTHITTAPLDGVVKKIRQERGSFAPAFFRRADFNMKNTIELSTACGDVTVVQLAGIFTRKILCDVKEEQVVSKGERIGKICFGSRVDVSFPTGFELTVKKGSKVKCRRTPIARASRKK